MPTTLDPAMLRPGFAADLLAYGLAKDSDHIALRWGNDHAMTAAELAGAASRYAQALSGFGLSRGTRVGILARNRPEVVHLLNAAQFADLCVVPLHPMGSLEDFSAVVRDAELTCLVFDPEYYSQPAKALAAANPGLRHLIAFGHCPGATDLAAAAERYTAAPLQPPGGDPEDIERMAYTGGTTGAPKGVLVSRRALATMYAIQMADWEWPSDPRALLCAPLSHSGSALLVPILLRGGCLTVLAGFDPVTIMQTIQQQRINCILLVPTMIYALLDHPDFDQFDLSSLECVYYGASSISPRRLREAIERIGPVFFQFYGQAEAPLSVCVMRRDEHRIDDLGRLASCGRPVSSVRVSLRNDRDEEVSAGEPGEICVQGPLLMSGYCNKPAETAQAFAGGWLRTGDVAMRGADGFLRIVDRKKDMIITGGFNVFAREVEDVLGEHPSVAHSCVVGIPDERWGEAVVAMVVKRGDGTVEPSELIAMVRARKGAVHAPKRIVFVPAIPLSGLGKPDKNRVRAILAEPRS
jgi:fatty-acyl-CoA synthase